MQAASSAPTRAASRRAASSARSAARRALRAVSAAALGRGEQRARRRRRLRAGCSATALGVARAACSSAASSRSSCGLVVGGEPLELGLERGDRARGPRHRRASPSASCRRAERVELVRRAARRARAGRSAVARVRSRRSSTRSAGRARAVHAPRERLALLAARGERLLGLLAARGDLARARVCASSRAVAGGAGDRARRRPARRGARGRGRATSSQRASTVWRSRRSCSSAASAWRLSGRSRERASRSTSSARSRLSCVRSSLSWARRRRLRCLPEPGGLLDQQAPVARLGRDDRLDAALRDDRVHLLAQAGVGEHLEHVDEPAARAVEAVLALAGAIEPAQDRDLAHRHVDRAVGVVDDDLDLGRASAPARRGRRRR